ncbi:MAG: hypothetical protein JWN76_3777 [Chitinophagaceae bacterium]|nr:hypothetical protein [Chitinophagaceae bacterium]
MKLIKTIAASLLVFSLITTVAVAQQKKTEQKKENALKEHKCTAACKDGKHAYAHGEKGHTCTAACKKMKTKAA